MNGSVVEHKSAAGWRSTCSATCLSTPFAISTYLSTEFLINWSYSSTTSGSGSAGGAGGDGLEDAGAGSDLDAGGGGTDGGEGPLAGGGASWVDSAMSSNRDVAASSLRAA